MFSFSSVSNKSSISVVNVVQLSASCNAFLVAFIRAFNASNSTKVSIELPVSL